jgi:hypothetical protein
LPTAVFVKKVVTPVVGEGLLYIMLWNISLEVVQEWEFTIQMSHIFMVIIKYK